MTSSNTHSHHAHHHHHNHRRRWAWVQQGLRRNCLIGPVAFLLLVVLLAPYVIQDEHEFVQLPLVEAVPFFRRAKAMAFRTRRRYEQQSDGGATTTGTTVVSEPTMVAIEVTGGAAASAGGSDTALGATASAAVAEAPPASEVVTEEAPAVKEEAPAATPAKEVPSIPSSKKRTRSETLKEYNFPLFPNSESFEGDANAPIPFRYYEAHQHKDDVARKAVVGSLTWRKDKQVDTILSRPQPNYDVAKRILPHYFIGRSAVSNHVVFVQRPGLADLPLAYHNGLELNDMLMQYAFVFEYCWNILHTNVQTSPEGDKDLMIGIMDLQGVGLGVVRKPDLINFVKEFVGMIDAHYPTRAHKTIMVNAPGWFSTLYKIISPIMRETTKEKIVLYSAGKAQTAALEEALGKEMATTLSEALRIQDKKEKKKLKEEKGELALTSDILLETEMEQEMRQFVMDRLEADGLEMKKIVPLSS